ncbi:MAG: serine hydrolase [Devosia nanyangense]|uniref:Serine hydrolase n=1 Tax=Devosia nanyangense TaxID=1228055 RepID=A0A933NYJ8_9HYPH|nr:serine hydrolase [Devosia nanyangense]
MRLIAALAVLLFAVSGMSVARAGDKEIAAIEAVLAPGPVDTTLFSADFLKAVPPAALEPVLARIKTTIGPVVAVEPRGGQSYAVETATHEMLADIGLDGAGKIAGLLLHPPLARNASLADLLEALGAVAPQSAYLITRDGATLYSSEPDMALAVGSAFKLGVLKALKDEIDAGTRRWSDVVVLSAADISFPSGFLQTWPVGSPLTLHTLAALMISISDNTATDTLMHLVGRDKVEAALGVAPALTTRELFTLKADAGLKARYVAADLSGKRTVLAEMATLPLPDITKVGTPHDQGAEWYISPTKLCELIAAVAGLDVAQINPGVANKSEWASVSFKGGSEIGVLSLVTALTAKDGAHYCVSAVWNGPQAIDEAKATTAYASVLSKLAKG